ncbi:MAG TPA: AP protein [Candidatus Eisenbacteria bacterium]|nr:AP protein [Candidatus Eisenbacteria bacterium]
MPRAIRILLVLFAVACASLTNAQQLKTRNVILVISDGLRWQEVFTGAEKDLLTTDHGGNWAHQDYLLKTWWRDTPEERRKALFPFLWTTVATRGQIFGNQFKGSVAHVTNPYAFSYPGYNEILTGAPDPRINSNSFGPNPNTTVFEWLNAKPEFRGHVAVYATWNTFKDIFNESRSHLPIFCGWQLPYPASTPDPRQQLMNTLYRTTTRLDDEDNYDSFLQIPLLEYVTTIHPRVLFVGYGETDNWAHSGRYDLVLESAHGFDHFVEQLWNTVQSIPEYKDQTTIILTTDHGRGSGPEQWKEHGVDEKGSENIWIAVMGPDTPPLGERSRIPPVTQSQIAATLAALLGQDYSAAAPKAAPPIEDVLPK